VNKTVFVIVLAWNHVEDTVECLDSLICSDYSPVHYMLVDNASTDNTMEVVRERFPMVEIVHSTENLGVSGGYNLGMKRAIEQGADYLLIANNDIKVDPTMIRHLVDSLEKHPFAGMAMPKIYHYYGDQKRLWCTGGRWRKFPPMVKMTGYNVLDGPPYNEEKEIPFAPSCVLLLRRDAVKQVGYFDTDYFFYHDDWDYCVRYRKSGFTIRFVPQAFMWHKVSISTQKSDKPAKWWIFYGRSTVRYYQKHATRAAMLSFALWFTLRETIKGNFQRVVPFLKGVKEEYVKKVSRV
jgi:GT2 family glycosyltransferase